MIALDEHRSAEVLGHGGGQHAGGVFAGALLGVADLGTGDLEDEGADVVLLRGAEESARGVVGQGPDVEGRDGEGPYLSAAHGHVEVIDG